MRAEPPVNRAKTRPFVEGVRIAGNSSAKYSTFIEVFEFILWKVKKHILRFFCGHIVKTRGSIKACNLRTCLDQSHHIYRKVKRSMNIYRF